MILYMTLLSICFRYYLCSIGFLISPKIKIIMYFGHRFPLTSHIRGHLLSTQMALLRPSADIPYDWHTKGHLWIEDCLKHYRWACYEIHSLSIQLATFTFEYVNCCTCLCLYTTCVHTRLFLQHVACCTRVFVIATRIQICMRASLRETRVSYASLQYQYLRMLSFDIKNNKS